MSNALGRMTAGLIGEEIVLHSSQCHTCCCNAEVSSEGDPATDPAAAATAAGGWVDVGIEPVTTGLVEDSSELSSIELPKDERSGDKAALAPATPSAAIAKAAYCTKTE